MGIPGSIPEVLWVLPNGSLEGGPWGSRGVPGEPAGDPLEVLGSSLGGLGMPSEVLGGAGVVLVESFQCL